MGRSVELCGFLAPVLGRGPVPGPRLHLWTDLRAVTPQAETCQAPPPGPRLSLWALPFSFTLSLMTWEVLRVASCQRDPGKVALPPEAVSATWAKLGPPWLPSLSPRERGGGRTQRGQGRRGDRPGRAHLTCCTPFPSTSLLAPDAPCSSISRLEDEAALPPPAHRGCEAERSLEADSLVTILSAPGPRPSRGVCFPVGPPSCFATQLFHPL